MLVIHAATGHTWDTPRAWIGITRRANQLRNFRPRQPAVSRDLKSVRQLIVDDLFRSRSDSSYRQVVPLLPRQKILWPGYIRGDLVRHRVTMAFATYTCMVTRVLNLGAGLQETARIARARRDEAIAQMLPHWSAENGASSSIRETGDGLSRPQYDGKTRI